MNNIVISLLILHLLIHQTVQMYTSCELPKFDIRNINNDKDFMNNFIETLKNKGFVQIVGISSFNQYRIEALHGLSDCMLRKYNPDNNEIIKAQMDDNSIRYTIGSSNRLPISSSCGLNSNNLRLSIDHTLNTLFHSNVTNNEMKSMNELISSNHLIEHLHSFTPLEYYNQTNEITLRMHVDEGVMIAMTSGYYQGDEPADSSGLYLLDNQIGRCKAKYDEDALILLIGSNQLKLYI